MRADGIIKRNGFKNGEQLPLVLMDALDLDVEQSGRIGRNTVRCKMSCESFCLFARLTAAYFSRKPMSLAKRSRVISSSHCRGTLSDGLAHKMGKTGVYLLEPAPWRDAVCLVVDAAG